QAGRRNGPRAQPARDAVRRYLGRAQQRAAMPLGADPADAIIGSVTGGPDDESVNHDHYLYGWPKETEDETPRRQQRDSRARPQEGSEPRASSRVRSRQPADTVRRDGAGARRGSDTEPP